MKTNALHEYVRLIVEKIRTKKNIDPKYAELGSKFDLKKFKSFENIHQMNFYATTYLEKLGEGSSRVAYLLNSRHALKIAINEKGIAQNQAEVDVYTNPKSKPIVAKIYSFATDYQWLVSDLVKPLTNESEFEKLTGIDFDVFIDVLRLMFKQKQVKNSLKKNVELIQSTFYTMKENNLILGDIDRIDHWGKTPDGNVVILDYGFTRDVLDKHYSTKPKPEIHNDSEKTVRTQKTIKHKLTDRFHFPVDPNPPSPLFVSCNSSITSNFARQTEAKTN